MWEYQAKPVRIIDGDTYVLDIDLGFDVHTRQRIRLSGAYCPELKNPGGQEAKEFVTTLLTANADGITVATGKDPARSFERYVARVTVGVADLAELLIKLGLAKDKP